MRKRNPIKGLAKNVLHIRGFCLYYGPRRISVYVRISLQKKTHTQKTQINKHMLKLLILVVLLTWASMYDASIGLTQIHTPGNNTSQVGGRLPQPEKYHSILKSKHYVFYP